MSKKIELSTGTVTMRAPKVRDLRAVSGIKDELEKDIRIFANLTEMAPNDIEDLPIKDFAALQEAFTDFLS
ncbi:MAG: hypothetical protein CR984_03740 [Proteobacteria bacterium]|nr:MAG: hypothetical protein CR984_03740 [Pseudomonadota bacterium]